MDRQIDELPPTSVLRPLIKTDEGYTPCACGCNRGCSGEGSEGGGGDGSGEGGGGDGGTGHKGGRRHLVRHL